MTLKSNETTKAFEHSCVLPQWCTANTPLRKDAGMFESLGRFIIVLLDLSVTTTLYISVIYIYSIVIFHICILKMSTVAGVVDAASRNKGGTELAAIAFTWSTLDGLFLSLLKFGPT